MSAAAWVGPAIVAAFISSLVTAFGWFVASREEMRRDERRRRERVRDVQSALLAEIRAHRQRLAQFDLDEYVAGFVKRMEDAAAAGRSYTPFIPREVPGFIFDALLKDVSVLPNEVIDPVVLYYRQAGAIVHMADDLRSDRFTSLEADRKLEAYKDYLAMLKHGAALAEDAIAILRSSLGVGYVNSSASVPSDPKSA